MASGLVSEHEGLLAVSAGLVLGVRATARVCVVSFRSILRDFSAESDT